jgi:hypothetical protein
MEMVAAWVVTIPSTVIVGWLMYQLTQLPGATAWIAVGSVLFVLGGWIAWAMARALHASDVAAEIPTEEELREPVSAIPHLEGHAPREGNALARRVLAAWGPPWATLPDVRLGPRQ